MINKEKLRPILIKAEEGDLESIAVVNKLLKPTIIDSIDLIEEKIRLFIRINYIGSLKFPDAPFHREIDRTYAEQIHSFLVHGKPRYKQIIIIGYRESAKTTRVKMNQSYMTLYLKDIVDYINVVSEDGSSSAQFTMDMFNAFAYSKHAKYFPRTISSDFSRGKKESQTMSRFTTTTGVTYSASGSRKSKRGAVQLDIDEDGEIANKRPTQGIFDDIENETTVRSLATTEHIRSVMQATINGLDQTTGFWVLLGNYLSLRGNVAHFLKKYEDSDTAKIIKIPIMDGVDVPLWPGKYVRFDKELTAESPKVSIESIQRDNDNFDAEYMNNPSRSRVYFKDLVVAKINEELLVDDSKRDEDGLLIVEPPTKHDRYLMGVDTAKGVGKDQSAFVVYKSTGIFYEEVANFRSNGMSPEIFTPYSINIAQQYNAAYIVPESNYPGNEYIYIAKKLYNNIHQEDPDKEEYGIVTNLKSKPEMFVKYKKFLMDEVLRIRSRALYNQVMEYPADDVETIKQDDSGGHFDMLMAGVVGIFRAEMDITERMDYSRTDSIIDDIFSQDDSNNL